MPIPYGRQLIDDQDRAAVDAVLQGDWLTQGPGVAAFEEAVAEACDVPYAVAFSSGTAALHGAAFAAGLGPDDELVTSAMTFAASANCAAYLGATPRFADIDPETWNVDPVAMAALVGERTRAVVPVDFTGLPAPLAEIRERVGPDVTIIQDAAHSFGGLEEGGRPVGCCDVADMAMLSFHPVKAITTGEGGIVTTRDPELRDKLASFRHHGIVRTGEAVEREGGWFYEQTALGFNYRITDFQCALGHSQLAKLDAFIARRNGIADRYRAELADVEGLRLPPAAPPGQRHGHHLFVIHLAGGAPARRALYDALRERGIFTQVHYVPVYWHPWYRETYGYERGLCPEAERYYAGCLSLPCFPALTEDDQSTVIAAVRELV